MSTRFSQEIDCERAGSTEEEYRLSPLPGRGQSDEARPSSEVRQTEGFRLLELLFKNDCLDRGLERHHIAGKFRGMLLELRSDTTFSNRVFWHNRHRFIHYFRRAHWHLRLCWLRNRLCVGRNDHHRRDEKSGRNGVSSSSLGGPHRLPSHLRG